MKEHPIYVHFVCLSVLFSLFLLSRTILAFLILVLPFLAFSFGVSA